MKKLKDSQGNKAIHHLMNNFKVFFILSSLFLTSFCSGNELVSENYPDDKDEIVKEDKQSSLVYADQLDVQNLKNIVSKLTSDELEGRDASQSSYTKTEEYMISYLKKIGVKEGNNGSFLQKFTYKQAGRNIQTSNIIGIIEGTDLKDEYILLSAHIDHFGKNSKGEIFRGADDNASGVSALLEIAEKLVKAKNEGNGLRRSVIFIFPGAEEWDLSGSEFYANNPIYPVNKTKACINLDMIGRVDDVYASKEGKYAFVINESNYSSDLVKVANKVKEDAKLEMTIDSKKYNYLFPYSDNASFSDVGIPSVTISSGLHNDYHKPADIMERLDFGGMLMRTKLAFLMTWELANR